MTLHIEGSRGAATPPESGKETANGQNNTKRRAKIKPGTKKIRVVWLLAQGNRLNCLQRHVHHDTCLHSTIAAIESDYGLAVCREWVKRLGWQGNPTNVCEYWLDEATKEKAQIFLNGLG